MTCIAPHAARRSASEDRQDEARAARAGNNACKVFHETRLLCFSRVTRHGSHGVRFDGGAQGARNQNPPRTAAQAARSPLFCALWGGMGRHGRNIAPEPVSPLPSAVRRCSRRPAG